MTEGSTFKYPPPFICTVFILFFLFFIALYIFLSHLRYHIFTLHMILYVIIYSCCYLYLFSSYFIYITRVSSVFITLFHICISFHHTFPYLHQSSSHFSIFSSVFITRFHHHHPSRSRTRLAALNGNTWSPPQRLTTPLGTN